MNTPEVGNGTLPPFCKPCGFRHVGGTAAHAYNDPAQGGDGSIRRHVPGASEPLLELANIRRLCARHGVREADGNGELRSTVAMVEEALIAPTRRTP